MKWMRYNRLIIRDKKGMLAEVPIQGKVGIF